MACFFRVLVAHSTAEDTCEMARDLFHQIQDQKPTHALTAGMIFASTSVDLPELSLLLRRVMPDLQLSGCSSFGEISSVEGFQEDSVVLTIFESEGIEILSGVIDNSQPDLNASCKAALSPMLSNHEDPPSLCILLSDVLHTQVEDVLAPLRNLLPCTPIVGGVASDDWTYDIAALYSSLTDNRHISPFLLLYGPLRVSISLDSGWTPLSEFGTVTHALKNTVYEIDGAPALSFYQRMLGPHAYPTGELPLAVYSPSGEFRYLRTSYDTYNIIDGSVTYLGDIDVDSRVCLTSVTRDSLLEGTEQAIDQVLHQYGRQKPVAALVFSCTARRVLLGTRVSEEHAMLARSLPPDCSIAGFYTYGEFCPHQLDSRTEVHNETFTICLIGLDEEEGAS